MHSCLQIPELLEHILMLARNSDSTLFSCAMTCHHFSEIALDILWGTYGDLLHALAVTMPPDLWSLEGIKIEEQIYLTLARPLEPSDIVHLGKYSRRLQTIHLGSHRTCKLFKCLASEIHESTLYEINKLAPIESLFPKIRRIGSAFCSTAIPFWLFFTPRLRWLDLPSIGLGDDLMAHALSQAAAKCPKLQALVLVGDRKKWPEQVRGALALLLRSCHDLRFVDINHLKHDKSITQSIMELPVLRRLSWRHARGLLAVQRPGIPYFPQLQELEHAGAVVELQDFEALMNCIHSRNMTKIEVELLLPEMQASAIQQTFELLQRRINHGSPLSLEFDISSRRNIMQGHAVDLESVIDLGVFVPLFHFRNLTLIQLTVDHLDWCSYDLDDAAMEAIASAWPLLRRLHLGTSDTRSWKQPYRVTLKGLLALIKGCPELTFAQLRTRLFVDDTTPQYDDVQATSRLKILSLFDSPIQDGGPVGSIIARLCPKLEGVLRDKPLNDEWKKFDEEFKKIENHPYLPRGLTLVAARRTWPSLG